MLPNFLCIGSQKAGTTWLYENLQKNPNVWLPPIKEIHYFDFHYGEDTGTKQWGPNHIQNAMKRISSNMNNDQNRSNYYNQIVDKQPFSLSWYEAIFNHPDTVGKVILGDITPEYSSMSEEGIRELKNTIFSPKIIWIIRDPLQRAISQVKMVISRQSSDEPNTHDEWIKAFKKVRYKNRANYKKYIPLWDKYFLNNELLYLPYGDIKSRPHDLIREIEEFLGIDTFSYPDIDQVVHKTKSVKLPDWIIEEIAQEVEPQYAYLKERFGENFLERTK